jgi:hypothetical protein
MFSFRLYIVTILRRHLWWDCELCVLTCLEFYCVSTYLQCLNASNHIKYRAYTWPLSVQALYRWSFLCIHSYGYNEILVTWKIVSWRAANFKPFLFSMLLSSVTNTFIPVILYNMTSGICALLGYYAAEAWNQNMTSVFCLHSYVIKSYTYEILKATCNSRRGVLRENLPTCGKPYFAGAAFSKLGICRKFPDELGKCHYRPNESLLRSV